MENLSAIIDSLSELGTAAIIVYALINIIVLAFAIPLFYKMFKRILHWDPIKNR